MIRYNLKSLSLAASLVLAILTVAACEAETPTVPLGRLHFPISSAVHPSGDSLYVVNSNFDTRYVQESGGSVSVIDTHSGKVDAHGSALVASFGGIIRINQTATKAYIPTRFADSVTVLDISSDGKSLTCIDNDGAPTSDPIPCQITELDGVGDKKGAKLGRSPYDIAVETRMRSVTVNNVGDKGIVFVPPNLPPLTFSGTVANVAAAIDAVPNYTAVANGDSITITTDRLAPISVLAAEGQQVVYDADDLVYVTSLQTDLVSTIFLPKQDRTQASIAAAPIGKGTAGIAKRPNSNDVFTVQRAGANLVVFRPQVAADASQIESLVSIASLPLNRRSGAVRGKGVAFEPSGKRAFVITQSPFALHIIDITPSDSNSDSFQIENVVPLKVSPTSITYHDSPNGPLLYITCTAARRVLVVDATTGAVVDEVLLGDTPSHISINETACAKDINSCVAYVSLYDDTPSVEDTCSTSAAGQCGSIAVIDLNPLSLRYHQLVRKFD